MPGPNCTIEKLVAVPERHSWLVVCACGWSATGRTKDVAKDRHHWHKHDGIDPHAPAGIVRALRNLRRAGINWHGVSEHL